MTINRPSFAADIPADRNKKLIREFEIDGLAEFYDECEETTFNLTEEGMKGRGRTRVF